ncbi:GNAT family N-acetyltransferase [Candidatus Peregrinibacteria bacterium]|nr:MAG: GNAT family N-acetyltransferase [Candidatus Peregrinibacteria bacterium]
MIVSRANPHGVSNHYFQIGGVGTLKEHRDKGYAKQVVSALCRHYFDQDVPFALLFTAEHNAAAQSVYGSLGFKPDGEFVIARY